MEKQKRFDPLNDFLFYKVMGEKGNEPQLLGFLNAVLGQSGRKPIETLEIQESRDFVKELQEGKSCTLDVKAVLSDRTKVNIEVQLQDECNIARRSLFYWSKLYTEDMMEGHDYSQLPDTIAINIVGFGFLPSRKVHTCFRLREDDDADTVLTSALEIHFVDMVKWRKQQDKDLVNNPLHRWLVWLDKRSPPEMVEEVKRMDNAIMAANNKQAFAMQDRETRRLYEMRQKVEWDRISSLNGARLEGERKGKIETAKRMKIKGYPMSEITEVTGLEAEDIVSFGNAE